MSDLGRHRRIYSLEWLNASFQGLDDGKRLVYFYAKTSLQSTSVGIYRLSSAVAVEEMGNITAAEFEQRLIVVCQAFGWAFDPSVRVLWMPRWIEDNPPQSPNVVTSWRKLLNNVPDCRVKADAVEAIHRYLKDMPRAFREAFGSYRVSLPEDFSNSQSEPQPQPESHQGSGIRDLGLESREQALRAKKAANKGTKNGNGHGVEVSSQLVAIARETLRITNADGPIEHLVDSFGSVCAAKGHASDWTRASAVAALNVALLERGQAIA